jgi:hypothetical protein
VARHRGPGEEERGGRRGKRFDGHHPGAFSGEALIKGRHAPAACACITSAQVEELYLAAASERRQDDARSDREWRPKSRRRTRSL